jgi:hypothetical protein
VRYLHSALFGTVLFISLFLSSEVFGQLQKLEGLVQFSGIVVTGEKDHLVPVPYAMVKIINENRYTYTDPRGFFSIVAARGQKIDFSAYGFISGQYTISDTLKLQRYSIVQLLSKDSLTKSTTVVFPWPRREFFRLEFLAMNVTDDLADRVAANLAQDRMQKLVKGLPRDGAENGMMYLRQQAAKNYYYGQIPPMNIFSPLAWMQFFNDWKKGRFKYQAPEDNE